MTTKEAQSEAPSVDSQIERMIDRLDPFNISHNDFEYLKPRIMAKINRLLVEARIDELEYVSSDVDGWLFTTAGGKEQDVEDRIKELSNNLSKGDGDEANGA